MAYYSLADIIGFGGAAGGGKSDWEIGTALTQHRRTTIFRRVKNEGEDLQQRAREILDAAGEPYTVSGNVISVTREDRQLEFGGILYADDWRKQKGRPRDAFLFDEASEFDEAMIRSLVAWNRTAIPGQRCKIGLGFNPPTIKHGMWLIGYFAPWLDPKHPKPAESGEIRWCITVNDEDVWVDGPEPVEMETTGGRVERFIPLSRTFIKSLLDDNEYYAGQDYEARLMSLPGAMRLQLRYGDFSAEVIDDPNQTIPTRWVLLAQERWIAAQEKATTPDGRPDAPLSAVGADPARGGTNKTAFVARINEWFDYPETHPGVETLDGPEVIKRLAKFMTRYRMVRNVPIGMDVIGVGGSPVDFGRMQKMHMVPMGGAEAAPEKATDRSGLLSFANLRAYWYWSLREALDPENGQGLMIPPDRDLLADLCAPTYDDRTLRGITIEKKNEVAKRLGRSPDKGDAFVYAFAVRPMTFEYQSVAKRAPSMHGIAPNRGGRDIKKKW